MKRLLSLALALMLIIGCVATTAYAEEAEEPDNEAVSGAAPEDPEGVVSWENLENRIRSGGLNAVSLVESIQSIEAIDYEVMYENLRQQLNSIASTQWTMIMMGMSEAADAMDSSYNALRETFDAIKEGELQADNADSIWQLDNALNQIVAAGKDLYINLLGMELSVQDAERNLAAIDRQLEEITLRHSLGLASAQAVADLQQSRLNAESQLENLQYSLSQYKRQLQNLIGEEPTGELILSPLPDETQTMWTEPDYENDIAAAKSASLSLYNAKLTLDEAKDTWIDTLGKRGYQREMADHTWASAQADYQAEIQQFEADFDTLYRSISHCEQVLEAKKAALAYQESLLEAARLKCELGLVSRSDVLTAEDNVAAAQSDVQDAWYDLFSAQNSYQTAVLYGIL